MIHRNSFSFYFLLPLFSISSLFLFQSCSNNSPSQETLAEGDELKILRSDFEAELQKALEKYEHKKGGPPPKVAERRFKWNVLQDMINKQLVMNQIEEKDTADLRKQADKRFESIRKQFPSEEVFAKELEKASVTAEKLKENLYHRVCLEHYLHLTYPKKTAVSEDEIKQAYEMDAPPVPYEEAKEDLTLKIRQYKMSRIVGKAMKKLQQDSQVKTYLPDPTLVPSRKSQS